MATKLTKVLNPDTKESIPEGATILNRSTSIRIEEIENGFLIVKDTDIRYTVGDEGNINYSSICKKYYSKTDPLQINTENKSIADLFN